MTSSWKQLPGLHSKHYPHGLRFVVLCLVEVHRVNLGSLHWRRRSHSIAAAQMK